MRGEAADPYDVAVVGGGIAGMSVAARLQAVGISTLVLEAHGLPGGCAGYFRRAGFAFDVGATTLVDFAAGGVGGELLEAIGMPALAADELPGYLAWLPDRKLCLHRDPEAWHRERLRVLGDSLAHRRLWALFDRLAQVFWAASRAGVKLPLQRPSDLFTALDCLGIANLTLLRYLSWTMGDALRAFGLQHDAALKGAISMLVEDTVHSTLERAPLINAVLGTTIRGSGLTRARGGMFGYWRAFGAHYRALGGVLRVGTRVTRIHGSDGRFVVATRRGDFHARRVVSALPAELSARIGPKIVSEKLAAYLRRDEHALGGAVVLFLGVPESEVSQQELTHHQLLERYGAPLGDGNNLFISVSAPGDTLSAPAGHRAVMVSTHTDLCSWEGLSELEYARKKQAIGQHLLGLARRVYPNLGAAALVQELATPRTYARFTGRPRGAVGGVRLSLNNSNQRAIPHDIGVPGLWLCGDTTWPGLGTVACVLGSRIVARAIRERSAVKARGVTPRRACVVVP
jgi:C-3',4' desaturase CrtD